MHFAPNTDSLLLMRKNTNSQIRLCPATYKERPFSVISLNSFLLKNGGQVFLIISTRTIEV